MNIAIIIPSRFGSSRLKGKPLKEISGKSMIQRVWELANAVREVDGVYVATDDDRIADHVEAFGGRSVMTPATCENGTERVFAAAQTLDPVPDAVINFQGDAVLTPPWIVETLVEELRVDSGAGIVTPAVKLSWPAYQELLRSQSSGEVGGTTVVFDRNRNALYFSKTMVPLVREDGPFFESDSVPVYKHIGLYAYRLELLGQYLNLEPGPLERAEKLEQLRALEHGIPVRVVEVDCRGRTQMSVDNPDDIQKVEAVIRREGELLETQSDMAKRRPRNGRPQAHGAMGHMRIILARHGNTFASGETAVWVGAREDPPLTAEGRQQALRLGRALRSAEIHPATVFCGPLRRTCEYAKILLLPLEPGPIPIVDERLREIDYGAWGGLSNDEIAHRFGETELADWQQTGIWPPNAGWRPGEQQVLDNVRRVLSQVPGGFRPDDSVVLVTSNGVLRFFLKYLVNQHGGGIDVGSGKVATGNVCEIGHGRDGYELISWNAGPDTLCRQSERQASASPAA